MRRYLLLPQSSLSSSYDSHTSNSQTEEEVATLEKKAIASINANANVLFGARLHYHNDSYIRGIGSLLPTSNDVESYSDNTQYFFACGTLLDIAKEDASINGQQVQALAALDGLCHWVRTCLSNNGQGSTVLTGLIHGYNNYVDDDYSVSSATTTCLEGDEAKTNNKNSLKKVTTPTTTTSPRSGKRSVSIIIESSSLGNNNENQRQKILEAITAIATGKPRKGHSIIGAGTYRDGMIGWMALSREYAQLSSSSNAALTEAATLNEHKEVDDDYKNTITNPTFFSEEVKGGSFEISLYKSRNGEVTKIEHLACTTPEYLIEAGGAMARIFFV